MNAALQVAEQSIGSDFFDAPRTHPGDRILFDEPGRVIGKSNYRSHHFLVVQDEPGYLCLLVKHGRGEERLDLGHSHHLVAALKALPPDDRYVLLYALLEAHTTGAMKTRKEVFDAFAQGRLRKRKHRGEPRPRVWIEQN